MPYKDEPSRNQAVGIFFMCAVLCFILIGFTISTRLGLALLAAFFIALAAFAATVPVKKNGE